MREDHCTRCGACCAAFRVDFHPSELASSTPGGVPDALTVPVTATLVRMRGTDEAAPRCVALEGEIGVSVSCRAYEARPEPCRLVTVGDDQCRRARERHGLAPLDTPA